MTKRFLILSVLVFLLLAGMPTVSAYQFSEIGVSQSTSSNFALSQNYTTLGLNSLQLSITPSSQKVQPYDMNLSTSCTVTNSCILWAKLDENTSTYVNDSSGNNLNGTWQGTNPTHWTSGKYNSGGNFSNAYGDYVKFPNSPKFDVVNKTIVIWFKPLIGDTATRNLISKLNISTNPGLGFFINEVSSTGTATVNVFNETYQQHGLSKGGFVPGVWNHLVVAFNSTNIEMIRNGVSLGNLTVSGYSFATAQNLTIGAYSYSGTVNLNGSIDNVKIYNTTWNATMAMQDYLDALSQIQIKTSSNNTLSSNWNSTSDNPLNIPFSVSDGDINQLSFILPASVNQSSVVISDYTNSTTNFTPSLVLNYSSLNKNYNQGWETILNYDYTSLSSIPNGFLSSGTNSPVGNTTIAMNNGIVINYTNKYHYGRLYLGQFYTAGHTRYKFNISMTKNTTNPIMTINIGNRALPLVYFDGTNYRVYNTFYNSTDVLNSTQYYVDIPTPEFWVEIFSNGTVTVSDSDSSNSISIIFHQDWSNPYPYDFLTPSWISFYSSQADTLDTLSFKVLSVQQQVPKNLITITANNNTMGYGFDARYRVYYGMDWLNSHNQTSTYYWDRTYYWNDPVDKSYNNTLRSYYLSKVQSRQYELGIHFSTNLITDPTWQNTVDTELQNASETFGQYPKVWSCLQNLCNGTHAVYIWNKYKIPWRESSDASQTIKDIGSIGDFTSGTTYFWNNASQLKVFEPLYSHTVLDPSWAYEGDDIQIANWSQIMTNYMNSGISIIGYGKWYHQNALSGANITNVYFSPSNSHFNINTSGYNATTQINDPNTGGNWFWYANGGTVTTTISSSNITNLTINVPLDSTIQKANGTITPTNYSGNVIVTVNTWNATGDFLVSFNESSTDHNNIVQHNITNQGWAGKTISLYVDNVLNQSFLADSNGSVGFNWTGGYSSHQFDLLLATIQPDQNLSQIKFTSILSGTTGNSIITNTSSSNSSFSSSTLIGGTNETLGHSNWNPSNNPSMVTGSKLWSSTSGILIIAAIIGIIVIVLGLLSLLFRKKGASL